MPSRRSIKEPVVLLGSTDTGILFSRGLVRCNYPVYNMHQFSKHFKEDVKCVPDPILVAISVENKSLDKTLKLVPPPWRNRIALFVDGVMPIDWMIHSITEPTVVCDWSLRKPVYGQTPNMPTMVFGPNFHIIEEVFGSLEIGSTHIRTKQELTYELARKQLFLFMCNIAKQVSNVNIGSFWQSNPKFAREVASEKLQLLESHTGENLPARELLEMLEEAISANPYQCHPGPASPHNLESTLRLAGECNLPIPLICDIYTRGLEA